MNIAWFIILLVLFTFGQSFLFKKLGLKKVTFQRKFNKRTVFAGQNVILIDEMINNKLLPIPWVRIEANMDRSIQVLGDTQPEFSEHGVHRTLMSLLPYQKLTRRHQLICTKRGVFQLKSIALTLGDIFGLDDVFSSFETDAKIVVYPTLMDRDQLTLPAQIFLGEQLVKRWIIDDPFHTIGTRDYQTGDPLHQINWKASARTKNVQVKVHQQTADRELVILLNGDQTDDVWIPIRDEELFEKSISLAATVAHYLEENGEVYSFASNIRDHSEQGRTHSSLIRTEAGSGSSHFHYVLEQLASLVPERSRHIKFLLDEFIKDRTRRFDILLITPIVTPEILAKVDQLRMVGHTVEIDHIFSDREVLS